MSQMDMKIWAPESAKDGEETTSGGGPVGERTDVPRRKRAGAGGTGVGGTGAGGLAATACVSEMVSGMFEELMGRSSIRSGLLEAVLNAGVTLGEGTVASSRRAGASTLAESAGNNGSCQLGRSSPT